MYSKFLIDWSICFGLFLFIGWLMLISFCWLIYWLIFIWMIGFSCCFCCLIDSYLFCRLVGCLVDFLLLSPIDWLTPTRSSLFPPASVVCLSVAAAANRSSTWVSVQTCTRMSWGSSTERPGRKPTSALRSCRCATWSRS